VKTKVFLVGSIDTDSEIHQKFTRTYDSQVKDNDGKESSQLIEFRSVAIDHAFPEKKAPKDFISIEGILKQNWMSKHFESIPSMLVYFIPFNSDWNNNDWVKRENLQFDRYSKLKNVLGPRDIKIITIMIKYGASSVEKDILEERINSYKRRAQLDSKSFFMFTGTEFSSDPSSVKRLFKYIKEFSAAYYSGAVKKCKYVEKSISEKYKGTLESILLARFNFKIAFYNEFQGLTNYSLKHYRQCYSALAVSVETIDDEMYDQVKFVAELAHYKICTILFTSDAIEEAFQQFKAHLSSFAKLYSELPWRHYSWVANQFIVFAQLLDHYRVNDLLPFSDRGYYYQNAAKYMIKRLVSFEKIKTEVYNRRQSMNSFLVDNSTNTKESISYGQQFRGYQVLPSKYVGSSPLFLDPKLDQLLHSEDVQRLNLEFLQEKELTVDHRILILEYLNVALSRITPSQNRRRASLHLQLAEQHMKDGDYQVGREKLWESVSYLYGEGWIVPAATILNKILKCAENLANLQDYIQAGLMIYSRESEINYSRIEVEYLHVNLISIFHFLLIKESPSTYLKQNTSSDSAEVDQDSYNYFDNNVMINDRKKFITSSYVPFLFNCSNLSDLDRLRQETPYKVELRNSLFEMFQVKTVFSSSSASFGEKLKLRIDLSSSFIDTLVFDKMRIFFIDDSLELTVINKHRFPSMTEKGEELFVHDLTFKSNETVAFEFTISITEDKFAQFLAPESIFCVEKVELIWTSLQEITPVEAALQSEAVNFTIYAYPKDILKGVLTKVQANPVILSKNQLNIKEFYVFSRSPEVSRSFVSITKPRGLLSLVSPVDEIIVLQDLLQRVDLYLLSGDYEINNALLYLSSDKSIADSSEQNTKPSSSELDYLLWAPDSDKLQAANQDLNVDFHPLKLNSSFQPAAPIHLSNKIPAKSHFCLPLFIRSREVGSINIKLVVEFVAKDVMNSALFEEFAIKVAVRSPLIVSYSISSDLPHTYHPATGAMPHLNHSDIYLTEDAHDVFFSSSNLLSLKTKCNHDLNDSIHLLHSNLSLFDTQVPNEIDLTMISTTNDSQSSSSVCEQKTLDCLLNLHEEVVSNLSLSLKSKISGAGASSSKADLKRDLASYGVWKLKWHLEKKHPLKFNPQFNNLCNYTEGSLSWLTILTNWKEISDAEVSITLETESSFPVPNLRVSLSVSPLLSYCS
jgi:hypothetical protein